MPNTLSTQLKVSPPPDWHRVDNPSYKGNVVLRRGESDQTGLMQMSIGLYQGGHPPDFSAESLIVQAQQYGIEIGYGRPGEAAGGACAIGLFGTAVFHPNPQDRAQLWFVSNSRDVVLVSYVCSPEQESGGLAEAQSIVNTMQLVIA